MNLQPKLTDTCSRCKHPLGSHYTSYDGKHGGCAHESSYPDQRDGYSTSKCSSCPDGFQITFKLQPSLPGSSASAPILGWGGKGEPYGN